MNEADDGDRDLSSSNPYSKQEETMMNRCSWLSQGKHTHSKDNNNDEPSNMKMEKNEAATAATRQEEINRWWFCWSMHHSKEEEK